MLLKASAILKTLSDMCSEDEDTLNITSCLQLYTKAILDITFFEENLLVDGDFLDDDSLWKVKELIDILSEPEHLAKESNQRQKPLFVDLDVELLECLHWRRGALLYMYCHTVGERAGWCLQDRSTFLKCLTDGVCYLVKMLKSRSPVHLSDEVSFQDKNTATLLSEGMFSDIHILALMYCGEMCFWALRYCSEEGRATRLTSENSDWSTKHLDFKEVGEKALDKYIFSCEGPLSGQGWNTEKAKSMQDFLKKMTNS
ncbi:hypothetical protein GDO86_002454 [Hymenochirus boettgeri]|nr:hypothetical protein GDO86_002454 [Hymenochirus boettgeri]